MSKKNNLKRIRAEQKKITQVTNNEQAVDEKINSLSDLVTGLYGTNFPTAQVSQTDTLLINNRYELLFYNRSLLSQLYVEHGLVQTLVDQPVDDAFRGGIEVTTGQLSKDEIIHLQCVMEKESALKKVGMAIKWGRLFGGGGLVIMTNQDPIKEFNIKKITKDSPLEFYPADLWELNLQHYNINPHHQLDDDTPYMFYGESLHKSRVIKFKGKEAPSFVRPRMRGWGMTEVERLVRSLNQYFKNQDVVFDLLDEAKVDVYKIDGLNSALMSGAGSDKVTARIQLANQLKNYLSALVMDVKDDYDQKDMKFQGLGEMLKQIRQGVASDLKMPMTKLFGLSSTGFNAGEDDIENYNSMVESEVRAKAKYMILYLIEIYCQKLFGHIPDDLGFDYMPLRILSSMDEQKVKDQKFSRIMTAFSGGLIDPETAKQAINKDNLITVEIDEDEELFDNPTVQFEGEGDGA